MKVLRLALVILCISACALPLSAASATGRVTFVNSLASVPPAAAASKRALTVVDQSEALEFSISFTMRSFAQLQNRIANGEKISPTEMESTYLPLANDYNTVVQWLSDQGFTITQTDESRLIVFASGSVAIIQQALQVEMARVTVEGKDYSAAQTFPSLPND
ncbi:MAG: protease pro-enzyme activation domain-containing protein, partial [Chthoniobacterales bacterium]